jgi:MFS family permease
VSLVSLVSLPFTVLMPIFADRILHGGPSAYGTLMGAIGVGAVVGALMLAMRQELRGLGNVVAYAAMGFSVTLILFGASRWYWMSLVVLVPCGFSMMLQFGATNTLIQAMVPNRLRGRVMSVYSMMFLGVAPVGSFFAGAIAERIGAPWTVALGGAASLIGAVIFLRKWPSLRAPARELVALQGMSRTVTATDVSAPTS